MEEKTNARKNYMYSEQFFSYKKIKFSVLDFYSIIWVEEKIPEIHSSLPFSTHYFELARINLIMAFTSQ